MHDEWYEPDDIIITEGERGDCMYLMVTGQAVVMKKIEEEGADRVIELDRVQPGGYFGEMALFDDEVRSATIQAAQPSHVLMLKKEDMIFIDMKTEDAIKYIVSCGVIIPENETKNIPKQS